MAQKPQAFLDEPPWDEGLTAYDRAHMPLYMRLIDAEREGADWREVVEIVFGLDPASAPERARKVYEAHLRRAHWMVEHGFRHLVWTDRQEQGR